MSRQERPSRSEIIESLWREHESILTSIHQRGTGYLMTDSILIVSSIILLSAIISNPTVFPTIVKFSIFAAAMFLIFASWYWFEAARKIDRIAYRRVHAIEDRLRELNMSVDGHSWVYSQIRCKRWYEFRTMLCWRLLFSIILIAGGFIISSSIWGGIIAFIIIAGVIVYLTKIEFKERKREDCLKELRKLKDIEEINF